MIVNPVDCSAVDWRRFDTWLNVNETEEFIAYLEYLRPGALLVGVTGDEPMRQLGPVLRRLRAAGIKIDDVQLRGSFAFIIQVGYPENAVFAKAINNDQPNVQLKVAIDGKFSGTQIHSSVMLLPHAGFQ
jgi:Interleukin-like EMT inducer